MVTDDAQLEGCGASGSSAPSVFAAPTVDAGVVTSHLVVTSDQSHVQKSEENPRG
jgi:hypothetical protein